LRGARACLCGSETPRPLREPPKYLIDHVLLSLDYSLPHVLSHFFSFLSHFFSSLSICYSPTQSLRAGGISARGTPCTSSLLYSATSARFASNSSFISIGALYSGFYSNRDDQVELIFLCWISMDAGEEGPLALETILCCNCSVH
jgi:hypothetical protein